MVILFSVCLSDERRLEGKSPAPSPRSSSSSLRPWLAPPLCLRLHCLCMKHVAGYDGEEDREATEEEGVIEDPDQQRFPKSSLGH